MSPIVLIPTATSRSSARGPTPGRRRIGNGARNAASCPGRTTVSPPGLRRSDATFATTFERRDAERAREPRPRAHDRAHRLRERARVVEDRRDLAEVEVPLVDPRLLDRRDDLADRRPDLARVVLVERVPRPDEDGLRAAATAPRRTTSRSGSRSRGRRSSRSRRRRGRAGRRRRPAARVRSVGILQLLDRCEERVEIEMRDDHGPSRVRPRPAARLGRSIHMRKCALVLFVLVLAGCGAQKRPRRRACPCREGAALHRRRAAAARLGANGLRRRRAVRRGRIPPARRRRSLRASARRTSTTIPPSSASSARSCGATARRAGTAYSCRRSRTARRRSSASRALRVETVSTRIVVDVSERRLTLYRDGEAGAQRDRRRRLAVDPDADRPLLRQPASRARPTPAARSARARSGSPRSRTS